MKMPTLNNLVCTMCQSFKNVIFKTTLEFLYEIYFAFSLINKKVKCGIEIVKHFFTY